MSAFDTFGGTPVQPARLNYRAISLTANVTLAWPWVEQDIADVVALLNNVTPSGASLAINMPPANQAPTGQDAMFYNLGANSFEVRDNSGNLIATVPTGRAVYIYITNNSTVNGIWQIFTFGAGASSVDAAALAGMGLIALASKLNLDQPVSLIVAASQSITASNRGTVFVVDPTNGAGTLTFDSVTSLANGNLIGFANLGTGAWTLNPSGSETIDNQTTIDINPGESCDIHVGAGGLYTVGRGRNVQFSFTQLNLSVAGSSNVTLTTAQAGNFVQRYTGILTGNIAVIVPNAVSVYDVVNDTTGAFQLTVKTAAGTGVVVGQGQSVLLRCDGTNVYDADTETPTPASQLFADGSAGAPSLSFVADQNLGAYRVGADIMGFTANGNKVWQFGTVGIDVDATGAELRKGGLDITTWATVFG